MLKIIFKLLVRGRFKGAFQYWQFIKDAEQLGAQPEDFDVYYNE